MDKAKELLDIIKTLDEDKDEMPYHIYLMEREFLMNELNKENEKKNNSSSNENILHK